MMWKNLIYENEGLNFVIIIIIIIIVIIIIFELTHSETILENIVEIESQAVASDFKNLSQ